MSSERPETRLSAGLLALALFITGIYPVLSTLLHQSYPLLTVESAALIGIVAVASALLGLLLSQVRAPLACAVVLLAALASLQIQFNLLLEGSLLAVALGGLLIALLRERFGHLALAVFAALTVGAVLDHWTDSAANRQLPVDPPSHPELPPVIHLILDGFIGPDGLPPQARAQDFRADLLAFMQRHGFSVHTRAYSRYAATQDSLTSAFNFRQLTDSLFFGAETQHQDLSIAENAYLDGLRQAGYRLYVYQSESVDHCAGLKPDRCWTHAMPNTPTLRENVPSAWQRTKILSQLMVSKSTTLTGMVRGVLGIETIWGVSVYEPAMLDTLLDDVKRSRGGTAYFAHLLMPHAPFVYEQDCSINYEVPVWLRYPWTQLEVANDHQSRGARYLRYMDQSRCLLSELEAFFEALASNDLLEEAIIVMHGDHGSSIVRVPAYADRAQLLSLADLRDTYSVLYVTRLPGQDAVVSQSPLALDQLIEDTQATILGQPLRERAPETPVIYLSGQSPLTPFPVDLFADEPSPNQPAPTP